MSASHPPASDLSRKTESAADIRNRVAMLVWNTFENDARVLKEAETLQASGWQVSVFALHTPGVTHSREVVSNGIRVIRVLRSPAYLLRRRPKPPPRGRAEAQGPPVRGRFRMMLLAVSRTFTHLGLLIRILQSRPAIVHAHDVNVLTTAWIAARLSRARLVYDAHEISTDREGYRGVRNCVARVEKRLMPAADASLTNTDMRARFFARAWRVPRPVVLQNHPRFAAPAQTDRLRDELALDRKWPIILYQGGLQAGRGLEDLVRAAAEVEDAYFVLIGGGKLERPLLVLTDSLRLSERVRFLPTVPLSELMAYTASADIGVQPLRNTCFNHYSTDSNKLFEYAMAGLPVVASDFPEIRKVVKTYQLGLLFDPEVPGALVAALKRLVESAELRDEFSRNAASHREALSWESQEHKLVELYQRLLA